MRILFIVRSIGYGGASKQLALTANAMASYGHAVAIYSYNWNDLMQTLDDNVQYIPDNNIVKNSKLEYIVTPFKIRKVVKRLNPDVVVSWRANAGCMAVLACLGLGVKTIFSERTDPYMETNWMLKIATKIADFSDGGVFQTQKAMEYYKRLAKKSIVIPNPINPDLKTPELIPLEERKKEVAYVGRFFIRQKRQDIMLRAWAIIHKSLPDYKLSFYGDGEGFEDIKAEVSKQGLSDSVIFHGSAKGVIDYVKKARILVMSSDYEGIPNTIIESFTAGTPVVTTDCSPGGARVLIDEGENGFIVPIRDYDAIAQKTIEVINDDALSESFIAKSREKLSEFAPERIFEKWNGYLTKFE